MNTSLITCRLNVWPWKYDPGSHPEAIILGLIWLLSVVFTFRYIIKPLLSSLMLKIKDKYASARDKRPKLEPQDPSNPQVRVYKNTDTGRLWAIKTDREGAIVSACPIKQYMDPADLRMTTAYNDQLEKESDRLTLL